jgi:hypothetical protein
MAPGTCAADLMTNTNRKEKAKKRMIIRSI